MVSRLRQYEGWRCLWRLPAAALVLIGISLLPFVGFAGGAYLAADLDRVGFVVLGSVAAVGSSLVATLVWPRRPWRQLIAKRLWSYERPNAEAAVPVLIHDRDLERAQAALRGRKLNPCSALRIGSPAPDAPDLTIKIDVMEPANFPQAPSDEERVQRVVDALGSAGIPARVSGTGVGLDIPS
jgi:hypothetical protein